MGIVCYRTEDAVTPHGKHRSKKRRSKRRGGKKRRSRKHRTAAQKAATRKMLAANKSRRRHK